MKTTYRASDGAAYERFLGRWSKVLAGSFAEFARLPEDGAILDVGCGTGSLALSLAERRRGRVAGIDIAAPYVAFARSRPGGECADFAVGDACHLSYADRYFAAFWLNSRSTSSPIRHPPCARCGGLSGRAG
jgi:2-polyprenyl-3-methyl-5-hydroxy-6-metoxy-1,4-benzoquinol methylase